jgi:hypothetical protein
VRPHWLHHTCGTELAVAGIDLLVLRKLMGHAFSRDHGQLRAPVPGASGRRVRRRQGGDGMSLAIARHATDADHLPLAGYVDTTSTPVFPEGFTAVNSRRVTKAVDNILTILITSKPPTAERPARSRQLDFEGQIPLTWEDMSWGSHG